MVSMQNITEEQLKKATGPTWFEFNDDDREEGTLSLETREHGDVGSEEYSEVDLQEAGRILPLLRKAFPNQTFTGDTCDEFVIITIRDR